MNNTVLKNIAYVASGALFGALGGYVVANKVLSDKLEAELAEYKESHASRTDQLCNEIADLHKRIDIYEAAGLKFETAVEIAKKNQQAIEAKEKKMSEEKEPVGNMYTRLVNYASKYKDDEVSEESESSTIVENFTPSDPPKDVEPYLISVDQFSEEHDEFRKVSCTYYTEDNIICETSHNEKIGANNVGRENLDMLLNSDIDILYIRNEYLGIDYEIDKYEGSYSYEVLGEESLNE